MSETVARHRRIAFVTGGSGFVGARLIRALVDNGWGVRALARNQRAIAAVESLGAIPVEGEMNAPAALSKGSIGSEVIFHVAAMFKLWGDRREFEKTNVEGMRALIEAAIASRSVRKVVAVSAAAVVQGDPEAMVGVDEWLPLQRRGFAPYSSSKAEAEKVLLSANGRRPGFETIAIRPPLIWGAGMPMLDHMVETVKAGRWQWVDNGTQAMSTCHLDNLVDALVLAADGGRGGEAYFVTDGEDGTMRSVIGSLLATRGVKAPDKSISFGTAWTVAGIMGAAWRLLRIKGEPPITRQMLRLIGKPFTVRIDKARRELGYAPRMTWKQGIAQMSA
jgi:nucleoside-diphosphate-sugar epimerase